MPEESGHRMEAGLRAWAKHRREQGGKEFELHPANRRLLRDEVVRTFPRRTTESVPWRLMLNRFWSRTVGAVGLLLVLGLAGWAAKVFWNNLPRYGNVAMDEQNPPKQLAFSLRRPQDPEAERRWLLTNRADADRLDPGASGNVPRSAITLGKKSVPTEDSFGTVTNPFAVGGGAVAANEALSYRPSNVLATNAVAALAESLGRLSRAKLSATEKPAEVALAEPVAASPALPAASPASYRDEVALTRERQSADKSKAVVASAPASKPASPPEALKQTEATAVAGAAAAPTASLDTLTAPRTNQSSLALAARPTVDRGALTTALPRYRLESGAGPVLEDFKVQIDGQNVSLVDADGSVYRGRITGNAPAALNGPGPARAAGGGRSSPATRAAQASVVTATGSEPADFYFQVTGTNRSLDLAVQISGMFGHEPTLGGTVARREMYSLRDAGVGGQAPAGEPALMKPAQASTNATFARGMLRLGTNEPRFFRAVRSP